jgi:hypothetical protein
VTDHVADVASAHWSMTALMKFISSVQAVVWYNLFANENARLAVHTIIRLLRRNHSRIPCVIVDGKYKGT